MPLEFGLQISRFGFAGHPATTAAELAAVARAAEAAGFRSLWLMDHVVQIPQVGREWEDMLELLPLMWGPGAPRFDGRTVRVEEAVCYPRPLQDHVPILVGGSGERRTLRLVARHADACNLFGDPETVRRRVAVLHEHCAAEGRDPAQVRVTHLGSARVLAPGEPRTGQGAATAEEHIGRFRELAEAGVQTAIVGLSDAAGAASVERFAEVLSAYADPLAAPSSVLGPGFYQGGSQ